MRSGVRDWNATFRLSNMFIKEEKCFVLLVLGIKISKEIEEIIKILWSFYASNSRI